MKRFSAAFYKELEILRDQFGETEYDNRDLIPDTIALMRKHGMSADALEYDAAHALIVRIEKIEETDNHQYGLFPDHSHVALGENKRIRRDCMERDHIRRRKRVIDRNMMGQQLAWQAETKQLEAEDDALKDQPPGTRLRDIKKAKAEPEPVS